MYIKLKNHKRKIVQLTSAILYNINIYGFKNKQIYRGPIKNVCVPGLNCYSCPGAIASCPLGSIQQAFTNNKILFINKIPFYVIGLIVLFGVIFGRFICGFLCPFGLIQELIYKIKSPKIRKNGLTKKFVYFKYFILLFFVLIMPIAYFCPAFCKYICPAGTLESGIYFAIIDKNIQNAIGILFNIKLFILIMVIILSIFMYRFFCRFLCPLGAIYSFFNKISVFGLRIDENKCNHCKKCINDCKMDVKSIGDMECIMCMECVKKCQKKAIVFFPNRT